MWALFASDEWTTKEYGQNLKILKKYLITNYMKIYNESSQTSSMF